MTTIEQQPSTASAAATKLEGVRRLVAGAVLAVGVLGAIASTALFVMWVSINDDIYFRAVEIGQQGSYPPGHFAYGWFAAAATAVFIAMAICAAWVLSSPQQRFDQTWKVIWLGVAALITGAAIPAVIHYYILGTPLLVVGAIGLIGFALATRKGNVTRT